MAEDVMPIVEDSTGMRRPQQAGDVPKDEDGGFVPSGYVLAFGADLLTAGRYAAVNGYSAVAERAALDFGSEASAPRKGTITSLAWNTELGDATTVIKILVAGAVQATVTLSGAQGVDETLSVAVTAGQKVALEFDAGTAPGEGQYQTFMQ